MISVNFFSCRNAPISNFYVTLYGITISWVQGGEIIAKSFKRHQNQFYVLVSSNYAVKLKKKSIITRFTGCFNTNYRPDDIWKPVF